MSVSILQLIIIWAIPVIFAITLHEAAHGWVAAKFGDKTALMMGRVTLNPIKHIDPLGTILLPAILILLKSGFIFGWAKPVPVTWQNLNNPKRDMAFVALGGPAANLIMAFFWAVVMKIAVLMGALDGAKFAVFLIKMGQAGVLINLLLMLLNLIPIPPLDGSRVLSSILPRKLAYKYNLLEPYGFFILIAFIFLAYYLGFFHRVFWPFLLNLYRFILALFGLS